MSPGGPRRPRKIIVHALVHERVFVSSRVDAQRAVGVRVRVDPAAVLGARRGRGDQKGRALAVEFVRPGSLHSGEFAEAAVVSDESAVVIPQRQVVYPQQALPAARVRVEPYGVAERQDSEVADWVLAETLFDVQ